MCGGGSSYRGGGPLLERAPSRPVFYLEGVCVWGGGAPLIGGGSSYRGGGDLYWRGHLLVLCFTYRGCVCVGGGLLL